jgi:hypothetical protein
MRFTVWTMLLVHYHNRILRDTCATYGTILVKRLFSGTLVPLSYNRIIGIRLPEQQSCLRPIDAMLFDTVDDRLMNRQTYCYGGYKASKQ